MRYEGRRGAGTFDWTCGPRDGGGGVIGVAGCLTATWLLPRADIVMGIPLAYAAAYTAGLIAAAAILRHRLGRIDGHRLVRTHAQVAIATGIAGCCGAVTVYALAPIVGSGLSAALITLTAAGIAGSTVYVVVARLLRLTELRQLVAAALAGVRGG